MQQIPQTFRNFIAQGSLTNFWCYKRKTKQNDHCEEEFNVQVQNNHAVDLKVARANIQHFATD